MFSIVRVVLQLYQISVLWNRRRFFCNIPTFPKGCRVLGEPRAVFADFRGHPLPPAPQRGVVVRQRRRGMIAPDAIACHGSWCAAFCALVRTKTLDGAHQNPGWCAPKPWMVRTKTLDGAHRAMLSTAVICQSKAREWRFGKTPQPEVQENRPKPTKTGRPKLPCCPSIDQTPSINSLSGANLSTEAEAID